MTIGGTQLILKALCGTNFNARSLCGAYGFTLDIILWMKWAVTPMNDF